MGNERDSSGHRDGAWLPDESPVLCVTADGELLEECARVAAVAGVRLEAVSSFAAAGRAVGGPLLLGADIGDVPPRRPVDTVLVGRAPGRELLWRRAADLGVEHVAELPDAAGWLVDFLGRRQPHASEGVVLGVIGGCGGAGASTTAVLLAGAASARGRTTVLVDGDRMGGGLELWLSDERPSGVSWPDLATASGTINPSELDASLPRVGGLATLSWPVAPSPAPNLPSAAAAGVLDAARRAFELVVVDVGRGREAIEDFAWASDRLLIVVPGRLGSALAAAHLLQELPPVSTAVVARGRMADGVDAERLAATVGAPLAAHVPELRGVAAAAEAGRLLDHARRRAVRRMADEVLDGLAASADGEREGWGMPGARTRRVPRDLVEVR
ncbi:septum site-determining protein Ssd [Sinomonas sp. JGH33]|uniref:Septum site-determining protein Ssd n=1 Tax=Sinomonas terricola TaxID=3110330 RepID=A0ABU5T3T7_9MICC|nr:septum site-determining protein Ssd [Sinomonas sp. JGH33]MEA5453801.1 septum site-determining protein Ssd [Sinomonas sp. JGH33]